MKFTAFSNKSTNLGLITLITVALVNCNQPINDTTQFDLENAKSEITFRLRAYEDAMTNGDKAAFGNLYTEDAEIFHDGSPSTIGRKNIVKANFRWINLLRHKYPKLLTTSRISRAHVTVAADDKSRDIIADSAYEIGLLTPAIIFWLVNPEVNQFFRSSS